MGCINTQTELNLAVESADHLEHTQSSESTIERPFENQEKPIKILLLGISGCGKTTIIKQLKKIHNPQQNDWFPEAGLAHLAKHIKDTVVADMKTLCQYPLQNPSHERLRHELLALDSPHELTVDIAYKIKELYTNKDLQQTLKKRDEFRLSLNDNIEHFLSHDHIDEIALNGAYIPTFEDYIKINMQTIGYSLCTFSKNVTHFGEYRYPFQIADIGGLRTERSKWFNPEFLLDPELNTLVYVVAVSEYNMVIDENNKTNRLVESINMLKKTIDLLMYRYGQTNFFDNKCFVLLFNKYDLFLKKITNIPITVAFDDFPDNMQANDERDVLRFIAAKFLTVFMQSGVKFHKPLRIIRTNAVDTDNINQMFDKIVPDIVINHRYNLNALDITCESNKMDESSGSPLILQKRATLTPTGQHLPLPTLKLAARKAHSLPMYVNSKIIPLKKGNNHIVFSDS